MAYCMRFILTDEIEISLQTIEQALRRIDTSYSISASGQLLHSDNVYAQLEISRQGEEGFDEELTELRELAADSRGNRTLRFWMGR